MKTILLLIFALTCTTGLGQHNSGQSTGATILLDVNATFDRMVGTDRYKYLVVYADGTAEAEQVKRQSMFDEPDVEKKRAKLEESDFLNLMEFIRRRQYANLGKRYPQRIAYLLDVFTVWNIKLETGEGSREIEVVAFEPDIAKENKKPYPHQVLRLGCLIEKLRAETVGEVGPRYEECDSVLRRK